MAPQQDPGRTPNSPETTPPNVPPMQSTFPTEAQPRSSFPEHLPPVIDDSTSPAARISAGMRSQVEPSSFSGSTHGSPVFSAGRKKSKKKWIIGIAVALLLAFMASAGVFAFWYNAPDRAVTHALGKLLSATSMKSVGTMKVDSSAQDSADVVVRYGFTAAQTGGSLSSDMDITTDGKTTNLKVDLVGTEDAFGVKVMNVRELIEELSGVSGDTTQMMEIYGGLISSIDGKWVVITKEDLEKYGLNETDEQVECAENAVKTFQDDKVQQQEIFDLYQNNQFITASDSLGTDTINGRLSSRYELSFDKTKAEEFGNKLQETVIYKTIDDCSDGKLSRELEAESETVQPEEVEGKFELWVDMLTHDPTKFALTAKDDESSVTADGTLELNKVTEVTMPKADTTLDDLNREIESIQSTMYQQMMMSVDEPIEPSVLGIRTFLQ